MTKNQTGRCALLLAAVAAGGPAFAQTASQIAPPSYAPPTERGPQAPLALPADSQVAPPAGAETMFATLAGVEIDGGTLAPETLAALRARLAGKRVSVAEIFASAGEAEAAEARRGRVLLRVVVPRQDLGDGATLRLAVVEGFVERIDLSGVPATVRARVAALLAGLEGSRTVTLAEIERKLALAADIPGVTLRSTLAAGERPGGTVIRIDAQWRAVTGFVSFDNTLPETLGRNAFGIGIDFNSVLGAGELIYLRASGLPNTGRDTSFLDPTPRNRALAAGIVVPIGSDGLSWTVEGTDARTAPRHDALLPGFASRFRRLATGFRYPVVRLRALTVGLEAGFDAQDEQVGIITPTELPLSLDRLRIARTAADISAYLPGGGIANARIEALFGLDALGARSAADATPLLPLSRAGADADFRTLTLLASIDQPIAPHLALAVKARAQTSFGDPVANSQQIGIATSDGISPLPSGAVQGDSGYVARADLRAPFVLARPGLLASIAPYLFLAQGAVRFEQPTVFERRTSQAFAYGAGLKLAGQGADGSPGLSATLEYGRVHLEGLRAERATVALLARF